jgi:hypothetical protein
MIRRDPDSRSMAPATLASTVIGLRRYRIRFDIRLFKFQVADDQELFDLLRS